MQAARYPERVTALAIATLLLAAGLTARLTRLVVVDDIGLWWLRGPLSAWAWSRPQNGRLGWRAKLVTGFSCPFCVGFWIGAAVLGSLALVGGPDSYGHGASVWRWIAGVFTLNYIVAHIGSRLDAEPSDEVEDDDEHDDVEAGTRP